MARSDIVLFVSAGMEQPKKRDHPLARRQLYLNYGALTLATLLSRQDQNSLVVHGGHDAPQEFLARLLEEGLLPSRHPVMISMPSFYALSWAQAFCRHLKLTDPESRIIVGGRWVTGPDPVWLATLIPEADRVVGGLGEGVISDLVGSKRTTAARFSTSQLPAFGLNHQLVLGFEAFQPSIETSRGCGMGCAFCEERAIKLSELRSAELLSDYLADAQSQYGGAEIHPYLQSSFFLPNPRWASELRDVVAQRNLDIKWRCET